MKKINNELKQIVKKIEGNTLLIGEYSEDINKIIFSNKNILFCEQLSNNKSNNSKGKKTKKSKNLNIRKIRKRYKKNRINNLLVQEEQIKEFKNTFIKDSIYIIKDKIYLIKTKESEQIINRYRRYSKKIEVIECLDGQIVCIDVTGCKSNKIKDTWINITNFFIDIANVIGDILVN